MDAIETAVRSAFAKGDPSDPAFRERVYRAALSATERAIEANPGLTSEAIEARRAAVGATIERIESEFVPYNAVDPAPAVVDAAPIETAPGVYEQAPLVEAERRALADAPYGEPRLDARAALPSDDASIELETGEFERRRSSRSRGGFIARMLPVVVTLLLAAAGVWWALSGGLLTVPTETAEVPAVEDDTPTTGGTTGSLLPRAEDARDWVTIFSPDDPAQAVAPAGGSAEVLEDDSGRFMRIRSGPESTPVRFDIGQGILERISGGRAVFNIVARAEESMPTEIAVECDFGELGDCGRKRYAVNYERGDYLFEVDMPAADADGAGAIAILSDVDNEGKALDIYEIRVSTPE